MLRWLTLTLTLASVLCPILAQAQTSDDYELTVAVVKKALKGWQLYQDKQFAASFQDGRYTDPDPKSQSHDFWTNGRFARLDRDGNGHHETIFAVTDGELVYVGSIGRQGRFVDVSRTYQVYEGQPFTRFVSTMNRS